jgi:hypothetical protein
MERSSRAPLGAAVYTHVLGFAQKTDIPVGEARWLTVVALNQP